MKKFLTEFFFPKNLLWAIADATIWYYVIYWLGFYDYKFNVLTLHASEVVTNNFIGVFLVLGWGGSALIIGVSLWRLGKQGINLIKQKVNKGATNV